MKVFKLFFAITLMILTTACASQYGNYTAQDASKYAKIRVDYTEPKQLYETMGQPVGVIYEDSHTGWVYVQIDYRIHGSTFIPFVGLATGGGVYDIKVTTFWFEDGVLLDTSFEAHNEYVNTWEGLAMSPGMLASSPEEKMVDEVKIEMKKRKLPFSEDQLDKDEEAIGFLWMARRSI